MIIDPLDTLQVEMDTTLLIAAECTRRGHKILVATLDEIFLSQGTAWAEFHEFEYDGKIFPLSKAITRSRIMPMAECDVVLMRKDPPFDESYLGATYVLDYANTLVMNSPQGLRNVNEKTIPFKWPSLIPEAYVGRNITTLMGIMAKKGGEWVVKPLNMRSGERVFRISDTYENTSKILNMVTEEENKYVVVQRFIEDVFSGDKRIFLVGGQPIGTMNRVPAKGDFRANIHLGATPESCSLTERDKEICDVIGPDLLDLGINIACIDVIGGYLTEVNVTSPSGIPEINKVDNKHYEASIVDYIEDYISKS